MNKCSATVLVFFQQLVEFPAVLLNTATGEVECEFQYYVQPSEHPRLSSFCTELTGISQVLLLTVIQYFKLKVTT